METQRILERVGSIKQEIVIDKDFFYCGRMKESDLVCLSLLVSREHCLFTKFSHGLYVTDLGSSNGVFVNGIPVRPKKQVLLKENDLIGIGCAELTNLDNTMFVYKLKNKLVYGKDCSTTDTSSADQDSARLARKEQSKSRLSDNSSLPFKISKTDSEQSERDLVHSSSLINQDDDIQIIECTSTTSSSTIPKIEDSSSNKTCASTNSSNTVSSLNVEDSISLNATKPVNGKQIRGIKTNEPVNITVNRNIGSTNLINTKSNCSNNYNLTEERIKIHNVSQGIPKVLPEVTITLKSTVNTNSNEIMQIDLEPIVDNIKTEAMLINNRKVNSNVSTSTEKVSSTSTVNIKQVDNVHIKQETNNEECSESNVPIKEEPDWGCFSQVDIVEIDDDDDSLFPFSQLFDRTVKEENDNNDNNDELPHTSLFLGDDDDGIITIADSDDENLCELDKVTEPPVVIQSIKEEPNLEFVDAASVPSSTELLKDDDCDHLANLEVSTNKCTDSINHKAINEVRKELLVVLEPLPSTSKEKSPTKKTNRKGVEIIDPHFIKPKKKTEKMDKKDEKVSKDKDKSGHKHSDKKSKHASSSSKNSSKSKSKKETSTKDSKKNKKSHSSLSSSSTIKKSSRESKVDKSKTNNSSKKLSETSQSHDPSTANATKEINGSNDSSNNHNVSTSSLDETQGKTKNRTTKVKVKVSSRSRGDMLCDSMLTLKPKCKKPEKEVKPVKDASKPGNISSFVIPRRQVPSSTLSNIDLTSIRSQLDSPPRTCDSKETNDRITEKTLPPVLTNATNRMDLSISAVSNDQNRLPSPTQAENSTTYNNDFEPTPQLLKSNLVFPSLFNTTNKKVTFKENIAAVREYPIEDGNNMKKIKDGLSLRSTRKDLLIHRALDLKIEDFLARLFAWEPVWLEQQQKVKTLPPIVKPDDMKQLSNTFNSFEEYYKRTEVLLLLETWQLLLKEYLCTGNRFNTSKALPCTIARHSIKQMQTPNGLRYSMMFINSLVSRNELRLQNHPVFGDMIILEYFIKQGTEMKMRRAFAYVVQVQQKNSMKYLHSDPLLIKHCPHPDALLTYTVLTRIIDEQTAQFNQVARLRSILYLRSHLRLIQGLQYVPHSILRDAILKVDIEDFQLQNVTRQQIGEYNLVTKEKLNEKQMEAVIKFTNASVNMEPKIGLLIGPPGTGKSKVIANLVTQILYGDGRYVNGKPLRILLCAPSNAAVDEIVLRLLDIRAAIKDHRFKMVRIGRMESMHEEVKKISVGELAKREAQKTFIDSQQKNAEITQQKKHKLKMEIDALELLVASNPYNKIYKRDLDNFKAKFMKLTHKSPSEEAAEFEKVQNNAKITILEKANVIACTLSSCYTSQMEQIFSGNTAHKIATCIVDEATQCCEAETLIPLLLGVRNLILVGDPNQLPATVMSTDAKKLGLDRSLFTRVKESLEPQHDNTRHRFKDPVLLLNTQYRMVNAISHWPNKYFYEGKLIDNVGYRQNFPYQSYRIFNLDGLQDDVKFSNTSEATFVGNLLNCMMTYGKLNNWKSKITVGVITPYQNQKSVILSVIKEQTKNVPEQIRNKFVTEVNTIDSFQGQERDVIVMSCVRSSGIGFLSDPQRLCVALTRAKFCLILCGNFSTFQRDNMWKDLIRDARARGIIVPLYTTAKPSEIKSHVVRLD